MTALATLAALALAAASPEPTATPAASPAPPTPAPVADEPKKPDVRTLSGKISAVDRERHGFTVEAADGPVSLQIDRNTMVFLDARSGSVRDLAVGVPVRASVSGAANLAHWVEVRHRGVAPTPGRPPEMAPDVAAEKPTAAPAQATPEPRTPAPSVGGTP